ncbi:MAG: hypothetical protein M1825_001617 [Sarcosagium campestre]|nr:MAG: hypothetical protein M1825_001617 [Sarcosagium campestre]
MPATTSAHRAAEFRLSPYRERLVPPKRRRDRPLSLSNGNGVASTPGRGRISDPAYVSNTMLDGPLLDDLRAMFIPSLEPIKAVAAVPATRQVSGSSMRSLHPQVRKTWQLQSRKTSQPQSRNTSQPQARKTSQLQARKPIEGQRRIAKKPNYSLDRFIPVRRSGMTATKSLQLGRSPASMSDAEKLLRNQSATSDPFQPTPPDVVRDARTLGLLRNPSSSSRHASTGSIVPLDDSVAPRDTVVPPGVGTMLGTDATFEVDLMLGIEHESVIAGRHRLGPWTREEIWAAGYSTTAVAATTDGRGGLIASGTNAPLYVSKFLPAVSEKEDQETYERRLALALEIDQSRRVFDYGPTAETQQTPSPSRKKRADAPPASRTKPATDSRVVWQDGEWVNVNAPAPKKKSSSPEDRIVAPVPFRVLDAPKLRDDFYCSLIAYSPTTNTIAVALGGAVFLWTEVDGVIPMTFERDNILPHVTTLAFSSAQGGHIILAIGRVDGTLTLWSTVEMVQRFDTCHTAPISCLAWKPRLSQRPSSRPLAQGKLAMTEELLVGDEKGTVWYYAVEWASPEEQARTKWDGAMVPLARLDVHLEPVCGLAWSPDGDYFASGGNDNSCCIFEAKKMRPLGSDEITPRRNIRHWRMAQRYRPEALHRFFGCELHRFFHNAAVKAIAFCPWQSGLVATGGGSNDRCIRFWHVNSGACLATIGVAAQVTSLVWSPGRREIAATFGYPQPEHPYHIAVYSWPDCTQIQAIPWQGELRALQAISYPGGSHDNSSFRDARGAWTTDTNGGGCIVVASSDQSIKFYEVWGDSRKPTGSGPGMLGHSDILEMYEGIEKDTDEVIR